MKGWSDNIEVKLTLHRCFFTFDMDKKLETICQLGWKERLQINTISKFESDLLPKVTKIWLLKAAKFSRHWYGGVGGREEAQTFPLSPTIQTSVKFRNLRQDVSLSKFPVLLILRRFFQWCPRCFPNWSMSKVKNRESSKVKNGFCLIEKSCTYYLWKILLTCAMSASVFFSCFIDNNNRNKKKVQRNKRQQQQPQH